MSPRRVTALLCAAMALAAAGAGSATSGGDAALQQRLARALASPNLDASRSSALAIDLRTGAVVFARNADLPLVPASNEKLAVSYAALARLGPDFRFRTEVRGRGRQEGSIWNGSLVLVGHGDPTLTTGDLAGLARRVAASGIARVTGVVVGDESWYDDARTAPGWKSSFYIYESPPLSALTVARGAYRGKTSRNPALAAASLFRQALEDAGVAVGKRTRTGVLTEESFALAAHTSEPLSSIVATMDGESDNFIAEILLKELGAQERGSGSTAAGAAVVRQALGQAGVPLAGVRIADGSGLSELDRLTADALVALLRAAWADPQVRPAFVASLAVAGTSGTLERRLREAPARGRVRAKTGTTNRASALTGFVGRRYAFSVIYNGSPVASWWAATAEDRFATVLAGR